MAYLDAEVVEKLTDADCELPLVHVKVKLTNQNGGVLVDTTAEVAADR